MKKRKIYFDDLEPSHCRYPENDEKPFVFCGDEKEDGSSYCSKHHKIVYTGFPSKPWEMHKVEEKQREAA